MNWLMISRSSFVMGHPLWVFQNDPNSDDVAPIQARFNGEFSAPRIQHSITGVSYFIPRKLPSSPPTWRDRRCLVVGVNQHFRLYRDPSIAYSGGPEGSGTLNRPNAAYRPVINTIT